MNKVEIFDEYVAALRSGEYIQNKSHLRETIDGRDCFCAIGVLGDVIEPGLWQREYLYGAIVWDHQTAYKIAEDNFGRDICNSIWKKNDGYWDGNVAVESSSFEEIADWLELNRDEILNDK